MLAVRSWFLNSRVCTCNAEKSAVLPPQVLSAKYFREVTNLNWPQHHMSGKVSSATCVPRRRKGGQWEGARGQGWAAGQPGLTARHCWISIRAEKSQLRQQTEK